MYILCYKKNKQILEILNYRDKEIDYKIICMVYVNICLRIIDLRKASKRYIKNTIMDTYKYRRTTNRYQLDEEKYQSKHRY